ncbi:MAG: hypothetical protein PHO63_05075 [Bacilli bacterium]|nr:hypothetical protein [Bacilli bacterium]MDD4809426.1 hypothetical protein [Bacilli bacterium]
MIKINYLSNNNYKNPYRVEKIQPASKTKFNLEDFTKPYDNPNQKKDKNNLIKRNKK